MSWVLFLRVVFLLFWLPPGREAAIPAGNLCFKRRTRWGERSGFPKPPDQSKTSQPHQHTGFLPLPGSSHMSGLGIQLRNLPGRHVCSVSNLRISYLHFNFLNLKNGLVALQPSYLAVAAIYAACRTPTAKSLCFLSASTLVSALPRSLLMKISCLFWVTAGVINTLRLSPPRGKKPAAPN